MNEFSSLKHVQHFDAHSSNDAKTKNIYIYIVYNISEHVQDKYFEN